MGILSIATGGMSTVYKYLAIGGIVLALIVGAGWKGYSMGKATAAATINAYVAKRDAEDASLLGVDTKIADRIVTQYVTTTKVIHDVQTQTQTVIHNNVPDHELLSNGWLCAHNSSALGAVPSAACASDAAPSTVEANSALSTVSDNYATCRTNAAELTALQAFLNGQQSAIAAANKVKK
jgi:hypothetical protein